MREGTYILGQLEAAFPLAHKALAAAVPILILLPLILHRTATLSCYSLQEA